MIKTVFCYEDSNGVEHNVTVDGDYDTAIFTLCETHDVAEVYDAAEFNETPKQ